MRSDVGDKNLVMLMKDKDIVIGGESSGHICVYNYIRSCDALYNSLEFVSCMLEDNEGLMKIINSNFVIPSVTKNVVISDELRKTFNTNINVDRDIANIKKRYPNSRIIVRPSGTESVIRIYVEGTDCVVDQEIVKKIEKILVENQA
jgi:phosphoglucosamine mutase